MKRRSKRERRPSRLGRIERKCDIILSELLMLRGRSRREEGMDAVIDRLHHTARRMRMQCDRESEMLERLLSGKEGR